MLNEIIGNETNKNILINTIKTNQVSHSYIFSGIEGIGKKIIAKQFAKMILCKDQQENCKECKSCIEFLTNNNPDFYLLESESDSKNIKIEQIREIQRKIQEKPIISNKKVYIIDNADTMTVEAQNCLLKTLEEPPEYIVIILISSNENNFLSTIKSRCAKLYFQPISNENIKRYLDQNYPGENLNEDIIEMYQGSIGKAITLKDKKLLYEKIKKIIEEIKHRDLIEIIQMSEEIYESKEEIYNILEYINILLLKYGYKDIKYINTIKIIEDTKKRIKANSNYDICIDNMLFNMWEEINEKNSRSKI